MARAREKAGTARLLVPLCALGVLAGAGGCGDPEEPLVPVAGKVTVNGLPLKFGSVSFRPDPGRGNPSRHHPTGAIDARGRFELFTVRRPGAPPGWYKVLVFADENQQSGPVHPAMPRWATHVKYTQEPTTDLVVEVVARPAPGAYDLKLSK